MKFLIAFLLASFVGGQVISISLGLGIRVALLDVAVIATVFGILLKTKHDLRSILSFWTKIFGPFLLVAALSLLVQFGRLPSESLSSSFLYLVRFGLYSSLIIISATTNKIKELVLQGLWLAGTAIALLGLVQYFLYPNLRNLSYLGWDPHQFRVFSTLLDPNFTGIILVLTIFLGIHMIGSKGSSKIQHKNTLWRKIVIVASGLSFLALLLTYSRGSYMAFLTGIFAWSFMEKKIKWFVVVVLVLLGLLVLLPRPGGEGVNLMRIISVQSRLENSQEALNLFSKSPIIGHGFNTLRWVRQEDELLSHSGAGFHNSWLFILATTGIAGLAAYLWMWFKILQPLLSKSVEVLSADKIWQNNLARLTLVSVAAVFTHSLFDNSLFYPPVMLWIWLLVGTAVDLRMGNR